METFFLRGLLLCWQCLVIPVLGLDFYTAAVYEHPSVLQLNSTILSTRSEALEIMRENLNIYQEQVNAASKQGVKIIVFPENGIHGFHLSRPALFPYLEPIPDPNVVQWNPCLHPTVYNDTEVLHQLSCMARNGSMHLIANMGERQTCEQSDPKCPPDGRYHFNTNVVFDAEGTLIAKYQKWNLYFEDAYDTPKTVQHVIFDTPFAGRFGIFTCFDILFYEPAVSLIENYGVKQIIFPTAWMNLLPLLSAIEFHQAFAAAFGINLFAANQHHPEYNMTGSGIYTPLDFPYYYNSETSEGKLLVAKVPIITSTQNHSLQQSKVTNYLEASPLQKEGGKQEQTGPLESNDPGYVFHNVMMFDNYTFTSLTGLQGNLQVCSNTLCCHVAYKRSGHTDGNLYALGAYDGLHTVNGIYYIQVCALVKCAGSSYDTCGQSVTTASDIIDFRLWGNFSTIHIYPEILADGMKIYRADARGWTNNNYYMTKKGMSVGLVTAAFYGRWYEKD
ncbi:biotinidase [Stegostoma tigrinum]|uniref:biotinidase n=1 Tax=Stegostoma tigrinum TaxID=3053191 RepID=UPI002870A0BA|nr:biotinidase [Stegostoma tigrinum]XP_048416016.2 biotinidase [Stegostoma tigrinum]XP_048416024.2 biotinidase [Stegostoma tigrinum]XP_059494171.1 biotinidase [Stegostoma tigrinum]